MCPAVNKLLDTYSSMLLDCNNIIKSCFNQILPCHVFLWQHSVDRHHVQGISVLPGRLQETILLQRTHIKILSVDFLLL